MFRIGVNLGDATAGGDDLVSRYMAALPVDKLATLIAPVTMIYGEVSEDGTFRFLSAAHPTPSSATGRYVIAARSGTTHRRP